jgi:ABC-2 type transport system ATP-binding protein/lipopolysaccharide transport system ATP-binding protein
MSLRLAFAVAAHMYAPIVVVDEVLAVGDVEFQQKCLGKMEELTAAGRTVVFVSHDLGAIRRLCSRTIWLEEGRIEADGPSAVVMEEYVRSSAADAMSVEFKLQGSRDVELLEVAVVDESGNPLDLARRDRPLAVRARFVARSALPDLNIAIYLLDHRGTRVLDEALSDTPDWKGSITRAGEYEALLTLPPVLAAGSYTIGVWIGSTIGSAEGETFLDREVLNLQLWPHPLDGQESADRPRVVHPPVKWEVNSTRST